MVKHKRQKKYFYDGFSAPEIILNISSSEKSDIWSFGCLVFYMLTGGKP
jgi:serine/threonine protein kinase